MADFSERLKQLRIKKGISQQELADVIGVNKVTISGYERGKRRPAGEGAREIYEKLADYFNVDISFLMGISDVTIELNNPLKYMDESANITEYYRYKQAKRLAPYTELFQQLEERDKDIIMKTMKTMVDSYDNSKKI